MKREKAVNAALIVRLMILGCVHVAAPGICMRSHLRVASLSAAVSLVINNRRETMVKIGILIGKMAPSACNGVVAHVQMVRS